MGPRRCVVEWLVRRDFSACGKKKASLLAMHSTRDPTPYRRVVKDKVQCPGCGRLMAIRSLQYRHVCKPATPPREKLERMRAKAVGTAIEAHASRMQRLSDPSDPMGSNYRQLVA